MLPDYYLLTIWIVAAAFTIQILAVIIGFVIMGRQLRTVNAVQAAIFLQMRQSFAGFDEKLDELLRRAP